VRIATSLFLLALSLPLAAKTFTVTNTLDSGAGSLRQAMIDTSSAICAYEDRCVIAFSIAAPVPESGWFTISPLSPLPVLSNGWTTIDGATQTAATGDTNPFGPEIELEGSRAGYRSGLKFVLGYGWKVAGLCINRFEGHGIFFDGSGGATISDNYAGVDPTGSVARPNGFNGIALRGVGGTSISRNLVSGNTGNGIYVMDAYSVTIENNRIGLARTGDAAIPNGASGIDVRGRASVSGNTVAWNALFGIAMAENVTLFDNTIFANGLLSTFEWPSPARPVTDPPVLTAAIENSRTSGYYTGFPLVTGRVHSDPRTQVAVTAYVAPYRDASVSGGMMKTIGTAKVQTDANGDAAFTIQRGYDSTILDLYGGYVTATAQPQGKDVSRSSDPIPLTITTPTFEVTTTADAGPGSLRQAIDGANALACTVDAPCRITFNIDRERLTDGAARIMLAGPLPALRGYVRFCGDAQTWWRGDTNPDGPEVEIRGGSGLYFGTAAEPVVRAYVNAVALNGSDADGLTIVATPQDIPQISQARIMVLNVYSGTDVHGMTAVPNAGSGLRLEGGKNSSAIFQTNALVANCLFSGNRQHGVILGGELHTLSMNLIGINASRTAALSNGGDGVYVTAGTRHSLSANTIAYNGKAGVATAKGVRAPSIISSIYRNGGLGIDVNDDGVSPNDGNSEDGTIDAPAITRAWYDADANLTYFEGTDRADVFPLYPTFGLYGDYFGHTFFFSDEPDPSGRGEGQNGIGTSYPPLKRVDGPNGSFRVSLTGDLRGKYLTATTNRFYCYLDAGCTSRESSEFSVAFKVE
jgi:parallel beta-helix repeat protein